MERIYTISEAANVTGIKESTLRHWEKEFKDALSISRDKNGSRIYTQLDMDKFKRIRDMRKKGLSLSGIKQVLQSLQQEEPIDSSLEVAATKEVDAPTASVESYFLSNISQKLSDQLNVQFREVVREELKTLLNEQSKQFEEIVGNRLTQKKPWWRFWL